MKLVVLATEPPGVTTVMSPLLALTGTVAFSVESSTMVMAEVPKPLNLTEVVPVKFVPKMVTSVPAGPLSGVKLVMVGAG